MISKEEQKLLIEKFVRANKNFKDNEDLFEDFCSEAEQKLYMYINSVDNIQKIESYISKVANTSILTILKDYGRIKRVKREYIQAQQPVQKAENRQIKPVEPVKISSVTTQDETRDFSFLDNETDTKQTIDSSFIWDLPDPKTTEEKNLITKECLQKIADTICVIHQEVPSMQFLNIFYLRYISGMKQAEISQVLELPKDEICKRLMKLSKIISNILKKNDRS